MILDVLVRLGGGLIGGYAAYAVAYLLAAGLEPERRSIAAWAAALVAGAASIWLTDIVTHRPLAALKRALGAMPLQDLIVAVLGLFVGLLLSALAAIPLSLLPDLLGRVMPLVAAVALAYGGVAVALARRREFLALAPGWLRRQAPTDAGPRVVVDTSAIIDGRIADVAAAGFLPGTLVVPRCVLDELQRVADSADALRRHRGRRGLDVLHRLNREPAVSVEIVDLPDHGQGDVDDRLVQFAREEGWPIVTTDYNLNRVATLQGVRVLNLNELANALKVLALPGEELRVRIVQDGREPNQGVGFLDDGTMVIVEGGRRFRDREIDVVVDRLLQTHAGRLIFAHPHPEAVPPNESSRERERYVG